MHWELSVDTAGLCLGHIGISRHYQRDADAAQILSLIGKDQGSGYSGAVHVRPRCGRDPYIPIRYSLVGSVLISGACYACDVDHGSLE